MERRPASRRSASSSRPRRKAAASSSCAPAERACPPEACGSTSGYARMPKCSQPERRGARRQEAVGGPRVRSREAHPGRGEQEARDPLEATRTPAEVAPPPHGRVGITDGPVRGRRRGRATSPASAGEPPRRGPRRSCRAFRIQSARDASRTDRPATGGQSSSARALLRLVSAGLPLLHRRCSSPKRPGILSRFPRVGPCRRVD